MKLKSLHFANVVAIQEGTIHESTLWYQKTPTVVIPHH